MIRHRSPRESHPASLPAEVMIATSGEEASLLIAPPPIVKREHLDRIITAPDHGLSLADSELDQAAV